MAERRMISKVISISEKVNNLSIFGKLLYTWMIPHADDFGRLPGSPAKVRGLVMPMGDETVKDTEQALSEMDKHGLIVWYEVNGERFIQITNFDKHQSGLHKRTVSKYPDPPTKDTEQEQSFPEFPGSSEKFPSELELEGNKKNTATTTREENFVQAYKRVKNRDITPFQAEQLDAFIKDDGFEESTIVHAIERAGTADSSGIRLILTILRDYASVNAKTVESAKAFDAEFDARRNRGDPRGKRQREMDELDKLIEEESRRGTNRDSPPIQDDQKALSGF